MYGPSPRLLRGYCLQQFKISDEPLNKEVSTKRGLLDHLMNQFPPARPNCPHSDRNFPKQRISNLLLKVEETLARTGSCISEIASTITSDDSAQTHLDAEYSRRECIHE